MVEKAVTDLFTVPVAAAAEVAMILKIMAAELPVDTAQDVAVTVMAHTPPMHPTAW